MNKNILIAMALMALTQAMSFLQIQSQFFWDWGKNHPVILSFIGMPLTYLLIVSVRYCALGFDGQIWPGRLIGFAIGAIVFTILSWVIMKEPLNTKTIICLILSSAILGVQILWK